MILLPPESEIEAWGERALAAVATSGEHHVLMGLLSKARGLPVLWPTSDELAAWTRTTAKTVMRHLGGLERLGLIRRDRMKSAMGLRLIVLVDHPSIRLQAESGPRRIGDRVGERAPMALLGCYGRTAECVSDDDADAEDYGDRVVRAVVDGVAGHEACFLRSEWDDAQTSLALAADHLGRPTAPPTLRIWSDAS